MRGIICKKSRCLIAKDEKINPNPKLNNESNKNTIGK
jgi:hypothetical protein